MTHDDRRHHDIFADSLDIARLSPDLLLLVQDHPVSCIQTHDTYLQVLTHSEVTLPHDVTVEQRTFHMHPAAVAKA